MNATCAQLNGKTTSCALRKSISRSELARFLAAARMGDPRAMHQYAMACDDPVERQRWLRDAALAGHAPAAFCYALTCHKPGEKRYWLRSAAGQGCVEAMYSLAMESDDPSETAHWLRESAAEGHLSAARDLGLLSGELQQLERDEPGIQCRDCRL
jgi:TPR repeat protein